VTVSSSQDGKIPVHLIQRIHLESFKSPNITSAYMRNYLGGELPGGPYQRHLQDPEENDKAAMVAAFK
jgi:hypothetical protein